MKREEVHGCSMFKSADRSAGRQRSKPEELNGHVKVRRCQKSKVVVMATDCT